jgi:enoyl-CoA hydratase/carnithine racemase
MSNLVLTRIHNHIGFITLNRPQALNSLSLEMLRAITQALLDWKDSPAVRAVVIHSNYERAFCAGGDIRFFYEMGVSTSSHDRALLEDFFTEEYALNYLIRQYPKPYISLLNGIVMGGGMGIGQAGTNYGLRIVTERTKMAMPEVNIGFFPDVGGSYFLSRCEGEIGTYLGVSGVTITAADAIYAGLADLYLTSEQVSSLMNHIEQADEIDLRTADLRSRIRHFAAPYQAELATSQLAEHHSTINQHFCHDDLTSIYASLKADPSPFAKQTFETMQTRSPLMMCVTLEQIRRGKHLSLAQCLRMERTMVQHCFQQPDVLEGIRALAIDKDMKPKWRPSRLDAVTPELINQFFKPVWPDHAHPLRDLR